MKDGLLHFQGLEHQNCLSDIAVCVLGDVCGNIIRELEALFFGDVLKDRDHLELEANQSQSIYLMVQHIDKVDAYLALLRCAYPNQ